MKRILVAYASKTGSTKETADEIGGIIKSKGMNVEILSIEQIKNLSGYDGVVIGAPINGMRWLPEATLFVEQNQEYLKQVPTAFFLLSYMLNNGRVMWRKKIMTSLDSVKSKVMPVKVGMFGGRIKSELPAPFRFIFGLKKGLPMDMRDWNQIRIWANELTSKL